ncbi:MAG: hypothetical protein IPP32_12690 [Bacteroidetes bacterium]|nr:hypothetical protein [Bacteroidota bacterium]
MKNYMYRLKSKALLLLVCILFTINLKAQQFKVTSASDNIPSIEGELRWAIELANQVSGSSIVFEIFDACPIVINLIDELPQITNSISIDGNTQPANGYAGPEPKIWINGGSIPVGHALHGLFLKPSANNCSIRNLLIQNFETGIELEGSSVNLIENNVIFNTDNTVLLIGNADGNFFYGNIFGSNHLGLIHYTTSDQSPKENFILKESITNTDDAPNNNTIGGTQANKANTFWNMSSANSSLQIRYGIGNKISGNLFFNAVYNDTRGNINLFESTIIEGNNGISRPAITKVQKNNTKLEILGTSLNAGDVIEVFMTSGSYTFKSPQNQFTGTSQSLRQNTDVERYIGTVTSYLPSNSNTIIWELKVDYNSDYAGKSFLATRTNTDGTSDFSIPKIINLNTHACCSDLKISVLGGDTHLGSGEKIYVCANDTIDFNVSVDCETNGQIPLSIEWDFKEGSPILTASHVRYAFSTLGIKTITLQIKDPSTNNSCIQNNYELSVDVRECPILNDCESCIGSFAPTPGKEYIISGWVKEEGAPASKTSYDNPYITVLHKDISQSVVESHNYYAKGLIIDGWQRIEEKFTVPNNAAEITIGLNSYNTTSYFDDVRVFPINGNMKSYVYDPVSLKLVAELDENNYATFYEYDEEGKLIRLKKETERGIMTIKENRNSSVKR